MEDTHVQHPLGPKPEINKDYVIQSLNVRVLNLINEASNKDAIITQQKNEIQELKQQLENKLLKNQKRTQK